MIRLITAITQRETRRRKLPLQSLQWLRRLGFISIMTLSMLSLNACNQSSSDNAASTHSDGDGQVIIGLTDAEGDFSSYTVDVTSITLTKASGAVVHVLPLTTRVDFAQYTDMTEFLTAAMVPNGVYVKGTLTLDYSSADIEVENSLGDSVKVSTIVDSDGNPVSTLDVAVHLEGRNKLVIVPGVPANLTFDFDLNASNTVAFSSAGDATLTVDPFLLADVQMERPKIHRLRGPIADVDVAGGQFDVIIRPFHHRVVNDRRFGSLTVKTTEDTLFEINDQSYVGSAGLSVLDSLPQFTAAIVIGDVKLNPRRFEAREVYAGSSVPGGDMDVARGTVIARSGNVLTLKGATLVRTDGSVIFNDSVLVSVADSTRVKKQLSMDEHAINEISVGQRISVFGSLTDTGIDTLQMDASNGLVRMHLSTLRGMTVPSASIPEVQPPFIVDLQSINGRYIDRYDFSGTGIDAANDADPANYSIDTGTINIADIIANTPIKVLGFVTPFGSAPADFEATTIVDLTAVPAILTMNWEPETSDPFVAISTDSLILNGAGAGLFHHVGRGGVVMDLTSYAEAAQIQAPGDGDGLFEIKQGTTRQLHTSFSDFVTDLQTRLASGVAMKRITAVGTFNDSDVTIRSGLVTVVMQ